MPLFMMYSFVFCAYLLAVQLLSNHRRIAVKPLRLALILLPAAMLVMVLLRMCTRVIGGPQDILLLFSVAFPIGLGAWGIYELLNKKNQVNWLMVILLIIFLLAIGYVTLFSRDGNSSTKIIFSLSRVRQAIRTGSVKPLEHLLLNILLFMPLGFALPGCCPGKSDKLIYLIVTGFVLTLSIESIQYVLRVGECDLEDVVGNVLGTLAGWGCFKLFVRTK